MITPQPTEGLARRFDHTPQRPEGFRPHPGDQGLLRRDLGLLGATEGRLRAEHLRASGPGPARPAVLAEGGALRFLQVLQGRLGWRDAAGSAVELAPGDCAHLPPGQVAREVLASADAEWVEVAAVDPAVAAVGDANGLVIDRERAEAYRVGDGPRRFLAYRDPGVTAATGRRVNINIVRNSVAGDASTGWHYHTLSCQFVFVLRGWSRVAVDGHGETLLRAGDAMTIPYGLRHDVTGFSADFTVLELNLPADYQTIACEAPARPVH